MARRYDGRTTTFSPEGRLFQVEYAMESISNSGAAVGVLAKDGVVLATEKRVTSKLLDTGAVGCRKEKMFQLDEHIAVAVAGLTADANILINQCRLSAQRHRLTLDEDIPVEQLVRALCDMKQGYTQYGGQRPFGVSLLYAGWDEEFGFQLYQSDPSGNYGGWKATAIGGNHQQSNSALRADWKEGLTLEEATALALKVVAKSMDSTSLSPEKLEIATVTREDGRVVYTMFGEKEMKSAVEKANEALAKKEEDKAGD